MNEKITESKNPKSLNLDNMSTIEIIKLINEEDSKISEVIKEIIPQINTLIKNITKKVLNGGRIIYVGSGTSGRLGVLDASECPPTFSVDQNVVQGVISGGNNALIKSIEGAEDNLILAEDDFKKLNVNESDTIVGITTSGSTPYVLKFLELSYKKGALTSIITSNKIKKLNYVNHTIAMMVGPEILTGSTRMKSGTATKMVLNMISTTTMIKLNKVYKNYMVDLKVNNKKLEKRAVNIISEVTYLNYESSLEILKNANFKVKNALLMNLKKITYDESCKILRKFKGNLRNALNNINK
mgnify:FL=1|tara:strand:- start:1602 stop:2495 length:894 start_codon:yes stop_codon:yes gene_type:complete